MTVVEWIDIFNRQEYKDLIINNLKICVEKKGLIIHAYVIMSNHIHMIARSKNDEDLANLIRDFKRYSARIIYEKLKDDNSESSKNWMLRILESQGQRSSSNEKDQSLET